MKIDDLHVELKESMALDYRITLLDNRRWSKYLFFKDNETNQVGYIKIIDFGYNGCYVLINTHHFLYEDLPSKIRNLRPKLPQTVELTFHIRERDLVFEAFMRNFFKVTEHSDYIGNTCEIGKPIQGKIITKLADLELQNPHIRNEVYYKRGPKNGLD